jgi:hypothetical protein
LNHFASAFLTVLSNTASINTRRNLLNSRMLSSGMSCGATRRRQSQLELAKRRGGEISGQ